MRVYRGNLQKFNHKTYFPVYYSNGKYYSYDWKESILKPYAGLIVETGQTFESLTVGTKTFAAQKFYRMEGMIGSSNQINWVEIDTATAGANSVLSIYDIMESDYVGKYMGERSITATIKFPTPIDFRIGDFVEIYTNNLIRNNGASDGALQIERFYIYTEPACKKIARANSTGDAFETTVVFYPPQQELAFVQMRDFIQEGANTSNLIYTGFDTVTFYGGAKELLDRCMACLAQQYLDNDGQPLWSYELADAVNENKNTALERHTFSFQGNSVMDAIAKLNDTEGINTTFFINDRTIYVGYKCPYLCHTNDLGAITSNIYKLMYGKTSHLPIDTDHGGLFDITKTASKDAPITKLFAYGANRNLNRYYCSDRIRSGRYVNHLMLPSFSDDGHTDFILSEDGVKKYGVREGSKVFEDIYPSLRYMTYADIRGVKYCIKIKHNGLEQEIDKMPIDHKNIGDYYIARIQCYKVVPCTGDDGDGTVGVNKLVEAAPPEDLAVFIHAQGKIVKCVLYGGNSDQAAITKQLQHDVMVPTRDGDDDYIPGACFAVHDVGWPDTNGTIHSSDDRDDWFDIANKMEDSVLHRIEYTDTAWITDLYVFEDYTQTYFQRDGYSAWAWPRLNSDSNYDGSLLVNEVVDVEPIVIEDTAFNEFSRQQTFDLYLRDLGFKIDEQTDFGEMVFVFDNIKVSFLDGVLTGREYDIAGSITDHQASCVCAYKDDGTTNPLFFEDDTERATQAFLNGAIWRVRMKRQADSELEDIGLILPNKELNASKGDHIVLLDIYMPDIYIRAAENRLLKEAQRYLERNDRGNIEYAISIDKVRMQQIPNLAMQMREGVMMRMIDDDLNIKSDNRVREIFQYPATYPVQMYKLNSTTTWSQEIVQSVYYNQYDKTHRKKNDPYFVDLVVRPFDEDDNTFIVAIPRNYAQSKLDNESLVLGYYSYVNPAPINIVKVVNGTKSFLVTIEVLSDGTSSAKTVYEQKIIPKTIDLYVKYTENVPTTTYQKEMTQGQPIYALCDTMIDFVAGKHYDIVFEPDENFVSHESIGTANELTLSTSKNMSNKFTPQFVRTGNKYSFYLDESFNDAQPYYISLLYQSDGQTEASQIRLISVTEKDMDENGKAINYVDFVADSVNIKIIENTRPADVSGYSSPAMRERRIQLEPQPYRDIQATIKEKSHATTWSSLSAIVGDTAIEVANNKRTYEALANEARKEYRTLLGLRNSIFDPDSNTNDKCNYNFLRVMMIQLGADSMNFQLDKTFTSPTGVKSNYDVAVPIGGTEEYFTVDQDDVLHHFVFTEGAGNGGTWKIPGLFSQQLAPVDGKYPTYYVCLRCKRDGANDLDQPAWICSTKQYAVNDPEGNDQYWYFNWGILVPSSETQGGYTLKETRGNIYMYGDKLVAGKISTIAGNSFFDLTHGNFVLSQEGPDPQTGEYHEGLTYINGKLTIFGITDSEIGGQNLYGGDDLSVKYYPKVVHDEVKIKNLCVVENGNKYISTYVGATTTIPSEASDIVGKGTFLILASCSGSTDPQQMDIDTYLRHYRWNEVADINLSAEEMQQVDTLCLVAVFADLDGLEAYAAAHSTPIATIMASIIAGTFDTGYYDSTKSLDYYETMSLTDIMVQKGTKATSYNTYFQHLTDAIKGTTEVQGGLLMTNVLMLKNEQGQVKAGMSGLTGDAQSPENVAMWAGGSYQDALDQLAGIINTLPLLLTKIGIGSKIGCFNVDTADQVSIIGADGTSKFIFNTGDANTSAYMSIEKSGNEVIRVTTDEIHPEYDSLEFGVYGPMTKLLVENSTPKSSVEIDSFTTPSNTTSFRFDRKDAVYVFFSVYVNSPYGSGQEEFNINFKVKFGGATILTVSHTTTIYNYSNIEWFEYLSSEYLTFDQAASTQKLEITDISITSTHGSQVSVTSATLNSFIFGYAKDSSQTVQYPNNWQSAQGLVYRSGIVAHTIIGRNGMAVVGADGTTINFLNENGSLVFRAIGLPNKKKSVRQVINSQNDLLRLKAEFQSAGSSWNSWTDSDKLQFFNDVAALIPNDMPALSIQ